MKPPDLPDWPRGLRAELAAAYVGISPSLLQAERRANRFPAPVPLTPGRLVWLRDDLDRWLDEKAGRAAGSDGSDGSDGSEWQV